MSDPGTKTISCGVPTWGKSDTILLAHGEGGRLSRRLLQEHILPRMRGAIAEEQGDAARLAAVDGPIAFTTDSFVVTPLFFPGGDIGKLAVCGSVNDLCVAGARPIALSLAFILEEGLPLDVFDRVMASIAETADAIGVGIVTGDTKVVPRGAADKLFINTSAIGQLIAPIPVGAGHLQPGDELIVTGPLGRHGVAVLAAREHLALEPPPRSDVACLLPITERLRSAGIQVRAMRDATRGGLAAVLHEWAEVSGRTLCVEEKSLPVTPEVRGACELLGLDPIYIANEGVMVLAVPPSASQAAIEAMRSIAIAADSVRVGEVKERGIVPVTIHRVSGREVPLDEPLAAHLPRIC